MESDIERALLRLIVHPILWEGGQTITRISSRQIQLRKETNNPRVYYALVNIAIASLYGRFLVSGLNSSAATLILSAFLGLEEVLLRLTMPVRDRWLRKHWNMLLRSRCFSRNRGRSQQVAAPASREAWSPERKNESQVTSSSEKNGQREKDLKGYAQLASIDIICENSCIITSSFIIWYFAFSPDGGDTSASRVFFDVSCRVYVVCRRLSCRSEALTRRTFRSKDGDPAAD
jgi:hypothetical protein